MAKKFSIDGFMNEHSKKHGEGIAFKIEMLELENIAPSQANIYDVNDVADLKASIELIGLQQNLLVRETGQGKYELVSGHRRLIALKELHAEGKTDFARAPCKIIKTASDIDAELQLIFANSTARRLSDYELVIQAQRLKEILTELKESGFSYTGRKREIIAGFLKVSPSQVSKYESIGKNLTPELTEELKHDKINVTTAYELSKLPGEKQDEALIKLQSGVRLTPDGVKTEHKDISEKKPEYTELLPCPFCNGDAKDKCDSNGDCYIMCLLCGGRTSRSSVMKDVIARWNRRAK